MRELLQYFEFTNRDVGIDECGIQQFTPGLNYKYRTYSYFVLHYVESGKGTFEVNGMKYNLKEGDGFILRKDTAVNYTGDTSEPWRNYWIVLSGNYLNEYLKETTLMTKDVIHFPENSESRDIIKYICDETKKELPNIKPKSWYYSHVYKLLYLLELEFPASNTLKVINSFIPDYAKLAHNYMSTNYMNAISIQEVADFIGISRSYLYRKFRDKYNQSPQNFLQDRKMNIAKRILIEQDDPIYIVAEKVGYYDQLQFSKAFKNYYNLSPSDYREKYKIF